jgi:hypothetical protein
VDMMKRRDNWGTVTCHRAKGTGAVPYGMAASTGSDAIAL